ncbi:hypothetical protein LguiB_024175 [Lonicera macranthoides]
MATKMITFFLLFFFFPLLHFTPSLSQTIANTTTGLQGDWRLLQASIGISAMHMQLLPNNKVVIFDRTDFGPSNLSLSNGRCRFDPSDTVLPTDCTAHSVFYDFGTNTYRPLTIQTDTWCSSGSVMRDGTLVQTGGYNDGDRVVRTLASCVDYECDWVEYPRYLSVRRWYATNQILPNGDIIIIGGRRQFNYEFFPKLSPQPVWLSFLRETADESENNLYPFVHLLPDGNLFIFANVRSILFDYKQNIVVREFPRITGCDPRNYPSSGSSVMFPLDESIEPLQVEVMVCGGAPPGAFLSAMRRVFMRAISTCGRLRVTNENPSWVMEDMPTPRVMGDMILVPNGDVLIINGATSGTSGWENAQDPVTRPVIYHPNGPDNYRFSVMQPSQRPRLYHSTAVLLTDGRILVGGSNPHVTYNFTGCKYPTDLSLEAFLPPYLAPEYDSLRPKLMDIDEIITYNQPFFLVFTVPNYLKMGVLSVRLLMPPFNTHSLGMNQRMVVLKGIRVSPVDFDAYRLSGIGPSTAEIAPPGYYLLFIVHAGIPSAGMWVRVQ